MTAPWWPEAADRNCLAVPVCHACGQRVAARLLDPETAIAVAQGEFGVNRADILGRRRFAGHVTARAFVVWSLRALNNPPVSYPALARILGASHTSAVHLHKKAVILRLRDHAFLSACERLAMRVPALIELEDIHAC